MRIQVGKHIKPAFISKHTEDDFHATYKGCEIAITTDHGHGKPDQTWLRRFDITVQSKSGSYLVDTWYDCYDVKDAVKYALKGAMLI